MVWGGIISGIGGFIGNRSARRSQAKREAAALNNNMHLWNLQNVYDHPLHVRQRLESSGFNPAVYYGGINGGGTPVHQAQPQQTGGNEWEALGKGLGDAFSEYNVLKHQQAELEVERQRVEELAKLTKLRARPRPILQERNVSNGNSRKNTAGSTRDDVLGGSGNSDLGRSGDTVAPGRKVKVEDYSSGAGLTEINNSGTGGPVVVPGADGEPWGIDELATAVILGVPQMAYHGLKKGVKGITTPAPGKTPPQYRREILNRIKREDEKREKRIRKEYTKGIPSYMKN